MWTVPTVNLMAILNINVIIFALMLLVNVSMEDEVDSAALLYKIEGKVQVTDAPISDWVPDTKVIVDGGRFVGFIKQDGSFAVNNVPPGSYLVEISSPSYIFEPARVDISSKTGKMRARKSDLLRPTAVTALPYPLKFKATGEANFFMKREEWNLLSTLMNPMVCDIYYCMRMFSSMDLFAGVNDGGANSFDVGYTTNDEEFRSRVTKGMHKLLLY